LLRLNWDAGQALTDSRHRACAFGRSLQRTFPGRLRGRACDRPVVPSLKSEGLTQARAVRMSTLCLAESRRSMFDIEALEAFPTQIMILGDMARTLVQKALDEESIEKMRNLLYEINDCLNNMTAFANATVVREENNDNA